MVTMTIRKTSITIKKVIFNLTVILASLFATCSCNQQISKTDNNDQQNLEQYKRDSVLQKKRILAQDSVSKLGNKIFSNFAFGMSEREYEKAKTLFKEETKGRITIEELEFKPEVSDFEDNKLSCLGLKACDVIEEFNGRFVSIDYASILKERYTNRLGKPDYYYDDYYQECDSTSESLSYIVWIFDNRVFFLYFSKEYIREHWLAKYYWLIYSTKDYWDKTKKRYDEYYQERLRLQQEDKEKEERGKKYSNEL